MGHPVSQRIVQLFIPACLQAVAVPVTRPGLTTSMDFRQRGFVYRLGPWEYGQGRFHQDAILTKRLGSLDQDLLQFRSRGVLEGFPNVLCIRGGAKPFSGHQKPSKTRGIFGRLWGHAWPSRNKEISGTTGSEKGLWGAAVRKLSSWVTLRRWGAGRTGGSHATRGLARDVRLCGHGDQGGSGDMTGLGMYALDRDSFKYEVKGWALRVDARKLDSTVKLLAPHILRVDKVKAVTRDPADKSGKCKLVLLQPTETLDPDGWGLPPDECVAYAQENSLELIKHSVMLGYAQMNAVEVLRQIIPKELDCQHSFEMVGHIAHFNLADKLLPYKYVIGAVILDKNKAIQTVVNKVGQIENDFRVFAMEVIAGKEDFFTRVKFGGFIFELDYSKVYWNSRLDSEHALLVDSFHPGDTVWDIFAGIGPFAIPAAAKGCSVFANDLNPDSHKYLVHNSNINFANRQDKQPPRCFNLDARQFIRDRVMSEEEQSGSQPARSGHVHAIMNLPASAPEFLDAFRAMPRRLWQGRLLPKVHVYAFSKEEGGDAMTEVLGRCERALGGQVEAATVQFRDIRLVAPGKMMVCLSFTLPQHVLSD